MLYFYLYIIPCILTALYLCIPTPLREVKHLAKIANERHGEVVSDAFLTQLVILTLLLLSWIGLSYVLRREINIVLYKLHTHVSYKQARSEYVRLRVKESENKAK